MADIGILQGIVDTIYDRHQHADAGEVATYIPGLAGADPDDFGIAITTIDGREVTVGDMDTEFPIQCVSKSFAYGLAIEKFGMEEVLRGVGAEPLGESFNDIELEAVTNRPFNPKMEHLLPCLQTTA